MIKQFSNLPAGAVFQRLTRAVTANDWVPLRGFYLKVSGGTPCAVEVTTGLICVMQNSERTHYLPKAAMQLKQKELYKCQDPSK